MKSICSSEVISITSSESSSVTDYESTLSSRSDWSSSDESPYYSSDCEESEEDNEDGGESPSSEAPEEVRAVEEIWISSDEEVEEHTPARSSVNSWEDELDPPLTPSAPLSNDRDPDDALLGEKIKGIVWQKHLIYSVFSVVVNQPRFRIL